MKCVLLSVKPKWVAKILNGEKTIEVRKCFPSNYVGWVYIYCTKDKKNGLYWVKDWVCVNQKNCVPSIRNGKVVAKFRCGKAEEIFKHAHQCGNIDIGIDYDIELMTRTLCEIELIRQSHLTKDELYKYLFWRAPENKISLGVAIHISQLEIFDKTKKISEFKRPKWSKCGVKDKNGLYQCDKCPYGKNWTITCEYDKPIKAPQNYCYVEAEK